jgi:hypothetical protein
MNAFQYLKYPYSPEIEFSPEDYCVVYFEDKALVFILKKGYLSTLAPNVSIESCPEMTEAQLFQRDSESLASVSPYYKEEESLLAYRNLDSRHFEKAPGFAKDPLLLFFISEDQIARNFIAPETVGFSCTTISVTITNPTEFKSFILSQSNHNHNYRETIYILFPFLKLKTRYIPIEWINDNSFDLSFSLLEGQIEREELYSFLFLFKRYIKANCDSDFLVVEEW